MTVVWDSLRAHNAHHRHRSEQPARPRGQLPAKAAANQEQGLGKVPECLVHGLVMPTNSRTLGVLADCQSRLTAFLLSV
jgi:hypothetical protein